MATQHHVKHYLAHWLQLGKAIVKDGGEILYRPQKIIEGDRFSDDFEQCWAKIQRTGGKHCHLEGTDITIDQLLSPKWEIGACARCSMRVPTPTVVYSGLICPCNDLNGWPNDDVPRPRLPQNNKQHLQRVAARLAQN